MERTVRPSTLTVRPSTLTATTRLMRRGAPTTGTPRGSSGLRYPRRKRRRETRANGGRARRDAVHAPHAGQHDLHKPSGGSDSPAQDRQSSRRDAWGSPYQLDRRYATAPASRGMKLAGRLPDAIRSPDCARLPLFRPSWRERCGLAVSAGGGREPWCHDGRSRGDRGR
jgi:hypothetical protein